MTIMRVGSLLLLAGFAATPLMAQEPGTNDPRETNAARPQEPAPPTFTLTLGAGVFAAPKYAGSDEMRVLPLPIIGVDYKNRVFIGASSSGVGAGIGVNLIKSRHLTLTAGLGGSEPRPEDRADALAGMDDRRLGFSAVSGLNYQTGPLSAGVVFSAGLRDNAGMTGTGTLGLTLPVMRRAFLSLGGNITVANQDAMFFEFGVSPIEAQRRANLIAAGDSRLRPGDGVAYSPASGVRDVGATTSLAYMLSPKWSLFGFGSVTRLSDEAAKSSLVRRRTGWITGAGITVRL
jgi:outer membrane scaffolding protein for murein synthesis (MipA/OmpV family)